MGNTQRKGLICNVGVAETDHIINENNNVLIVDILTQNYEDIHGNVKILIIDEE